MFLIETPSGFCVRRREEGVLKGMNEFPSHVIQDGESVEDVLNAWGMYEFTEVKRGKYRHIFTHIIWDITCVWIKTSESPFDAYMVGEIEQNISLPTAFKQCMSLLD